MTKLSSLKGAHNFLRRNRKWPLSPFKTKWHQTFCEEQAMQVLKNSVKTTQEQSHCLDNQSHLENPKKSHLLTTLVNSFGAYDCDPTPNAYHFVIQTLCKTSQFDCIQLVLNRLQRVEKFDTPECIFSNLIKSYGDVGKIERAVDVFLSIPKFRCVPTVYSLNALMIVLCRSREHIKMVPEILLKSHQMHIRINELTFKILIGALCQLNKVDYAIDTLNGMISDGFSFDVKICTLILSSLCRQKELSGMNVLAFMKDLKKLGFCPNLVDYANVIKYLVKNRRGNDALDVLNQMKADGIKPDTICYTVVLSGIIEEEDYEKADELFDEMLVLGLVPDVYTYNVYIDGLCRQRNLEAAVKVVACMQELGCKPNSATYNLIIDRSCKIGELMRARLLLKEVGMKAVD